MSNSTAALRLLGDRLLVRTEPVERGLTRGGLLIPDTTLAVRPPTQGTILSAGPTATFPAGLEVIFPVEAGHEIDENARIISSAEVVCLVN